MGVIEYVNPKFTKLMGYTSEEALGQTPRIIKGNFLSREFYQELWQKILSGEEWHGVFNNRTKAGDLVWEVASISPIRDEAGTITHFVGVKEDITEIKHLQEKLEHLAQHDQLTGLPNRFLFRDRLEQALLHARRRNASFALLYLDLDGFKGVNDALGHEAGDAVLTEAGRRMAACVRASDTVARMGGDEFTVLLEDMDAPSKVERLAQVLVEALGTPFTVAGEVCAIGASVGIAIYPQHGDTADALLSAADAAMYQIKQGGRSGYGFVPQHRP
jgi:diguanylate cyclase (GGDEF)-like protein/PAS domain S-box-containing protein